MSQIATAFEAIVTRWQAQTAIPAARRAFVHLGGKPFDRTALPSPTTITNLNRETVVDDAVWVAFDIRPINGTERQQGISPTCPTRWVGTVTRHVYYPLGYGLKFLLPILDDERAIFHRVSLSNGLVTFRDCAPPESIDFEEDRTAGWGRYDIDNPFWVTEVVQ
jgi:hypothetical protein